MHKYYISCKRRTLSKTKTKKRVKNINVLTISCSTKVFDVLITASTKK